MQLVEHGRLTQQVQLAGGAQDGEIGEDIFNPLFRVEKIRLRFGVIAALFEKLLIITQNRSEESLARSLERGQISQLLLADAEHLIHATSRQEEAGFGFLRALSLLAVRLLRPLLRSPCPPLFELDQERAQ